MSKSSVKMKFTGMHIVWILVVIIAVCVVAYVVFQQCGMHKSETFVNETEYISPLDILPGQLSAATCPTENKSYSKGNSRVGMHQSLGHVLPLQTKPHTSQDTNPCELSSKHKAIVPVSFGKLTHTDTANLPLQAFKCAWARNHSHSEKKNTPIIVNLNISMHMYHTIDGTDHPLQQEYSVHLEITNKWTTLIPIPATIIYPKIAHTAKIYKVTISRTDTNHGTVLGVESISLVKYLPDGDWQDFITPPNSALQSSELKKQELLSCKNGVTNQLVKGQRIDAGILLFEPLCLVSEQSYVKSQTPVNQQTQPSKTKTPPVIHNPLPCQQALTASIHYNASGTITHQPLNTKVLTFRAFFTKAPSSGKMKVYIANINPNNTSQTEYLQSYIGSNGNIGSVNDADTSGLKTLPETGGLSNTPDTLGQASNATNPVPTHHIGVAALTNVQDNVLCEFSVALAEQIDAQSKYVMIIDTECEVRLLQYVSVYSTNVSSQPITLLQGKPITENNGEKEIITLDKTTSLHEQILSSVFPHTMIDPDSSIIRFDRHPEVSATPMVVCASKNLILMNDGFMFYGSLLIPHRQSTQNNNQILTLTVSLSSKKRLIFNITRDGIHLRQNTQTIKYIPLPNQANDYSWYIYIYQNTYCLNVNKTFFKGQHLILQEMFDSGISYMVNSYDPITNISLQIEPTYEICSRFVSAITYAPTRSVMNLRREDQHLLDAKAVAIYQQPSNINQSMLISNTLNPLNPPNTSNTLTNLSLQKVISYDSGISVQFEIVPDHLRQNMYVQPLTVKSAFTGEVCWMCWMCWVG